MDTFASLVNQSIHIGKYTFPSIHIGKLKVMKGSLNWLTITFSLTDFSYTECLRIIITATFISSIKPTVLFNWVLYVAALTERNQQIVSHLLYLRDEEEGRNKSRPTHDRTCSLELENADFTHLIQLEEVHYLDKTYERVTTSIIYNIYLLW